MKIQHGADVFRHRATRRAGHAFRIGLAAGLPIAGGPAFRQIAIDGIVCRRLVGHHVRAHATPHQLRKNLGGIAEQADRDRFAVAARLRHDRQRFIEGRGLAVEIACTQPHLDARRLAFDGKTRRAGHHRRERLRAAHAAKPGGENPLAPEIAAVMLATQFDKGLVGALNNSLAADIDPGSGGHLAVHHETLAIELAEVLPCWPNAAPDWNWRSTPAGRRHGFEIRRPVCRIAPAASDRPPAASRSRQCDRSFPNRALPGRCRHRPRVRWAFPPRRDRDCSSACASALR